MRRFLTSAILSLVLAGAAVPAWADVNPTSPEEAEGEIRRGENTAQSWEQRAQSRLQQSAMKIEPSLNGRPERAQAYEDFFPSEFMDDPRLFPFKVTATEQQDGTVALTGYVGFEENRATLLQFLGALGVQVGDESIEVLPSANLGEEKFGFVTATAAPYWAEPREGSERVTVGLMGDPVFLLRAEKDGFLLAMGNEGYVGHIHESHVARTDAEGFDGLMKSRLARLLRNETTPEGTVLPAGAVLFLPQQMDQLGTFALQLPSGAMAQVPAEAVAIGRDTGRMTEAALDTAHSLMGTPYVWGGRSLEGIDCSGLVQTAFRTVGVSLPRDSDQQALVGTLTGTRWHRSSMQRGDTVYFVNRWGTISHTGIYLGEGQYIEAAGPGVQITSIREGDENYSERRARTFIFSKRFIE